jgi:UDP-N-acetylglucosamine:LPS N-acetylglucosamine transferase
VTDFVKHVQFLYFDAGGGHRAAATALKSLLDREDKSCEISLVNVQELLAPLDVFRKVTGIPLEDIYNKMLAKGWTLGSGVGLKFMHAVIRFNHDVTVKLLTKHFVDTKPDLVVSLIPNFNRAISQSVFAASSQTPILTVITDFADYPPHFWIERYDPAIPERYIVCGTLRAATQARELGYDEAHVFRTSGMIIRPMFYEPAGIDRAREREKLGLDPARPTGVVLFGGQGSKVMLDIARNLSDTQLILICGKNAALADRLRAQPANARRHIEGFTQQIPYFMQLADFFIGKPGPGSISEAIAMKLPVIVESNAWTLPQERYNAEWVREKGVGVVLPNFRGIRAAADAMVASLEQYRAQVAKIENRAVFEIVGILDGFLKRVN